MTYKVVKRYGHEAGLSCTFRQWRATSHCRFLHGYALAFEFEYHARTLDERNWVVDFGGLKQLKERLQLAFDHKLLVAADDPERERFRDLARQGLAEVTVLSHVGCEAFAHYGWRIANELLQDNIREHGHDVVLHEVRVWEHAGNMAAYSPHDFRG